MKKLSLLLLTLLVFGTLFSQVPQNFKYQAVARNSDGTAITNTAIGLKLTIRSGSANGTDVYSESFTPVSNAIGIFTVNIAEGNPLSGNFSEIDWGADTYFLNVAIDPDGGSNYTDMGTTQFVSVPYSLYTASIYVNYSNDTLYIGDQYVVLSGGGGGGGDVTDYDGNTYETVTIGNQTWLKQNLRSLHYADGTAIDSVWVYNNNESNAATWGRLYNWEAAMNGASSSNGNPSGIQGACPDGWHIPSKAEFEQLIDFVGAVGAGWKLKETGSTYWEEPNSNTNETGFSARGSGDRLIEGQFQSLKETTNFWSATEQDNLRAADMILYSNQGGAPLHNDNKNNGFSIRCVKD